MVHCKLITGRFLEVISLFISWFSLSTMSCLKLAGENQLLTETTEPVIVSQ